jgi:hypothetical protein
MSRAFLQRRGGLGRRTRLLRGVALASALIGPIAILGSEKSPISANKRVNKAKSLRLYDALMNVILFYGHGVQRNKGERERERESERNANFDSQIFYSEDALHNLRVFYSNFTRYSMVFAFPGLTNAS